MYTPPVCAARMQTHIHFWPTDVYEHTLQFLFARYIAACFAFQQDLIKARVHTSASSGSTGNDTGIIRLHSMRRRFVTAASQQRDLGFESRKSRGKRGTKAKNWIRINRLQYSRDLVTFGPSPWHEVKKSQMGGTYRGTFGPPQNRHKDLITLPPGLMAYTKEGHFG